MSRWGKIILATEFTTKKMTSPIRQLLKILTDSVEDLEAACATSGSAIPDLNTPFTPPSEAFRANPKAAEAASIISAAALQIDAILTPPQVSLYHAVAGHLKSAALRVCLESNVTEILREAGPEGLHVKEIASKNGQDPRKLGNATCAYDFSHLILHAGRFIRYLAIHHIYREVKPDVFANTRISSMMDTMKPSQDVIDHPETKHENTPGLTALAAHHLDEGFKASAYAWETLTDPLTAKSGDPEAAPVARAFNTKESFWEIISHDEPRARRFDIGMQGVQALQPADAILKVSYDWKELPDGSVVVDVGGGVGTSSLPLAREFPNLEIVVQDLPGVIENAKKLWSSSMPNAKVTLEVHDFFKPQPKRSVSLFLLKHILHDWSDEYCVKFLSQLRAVARPDTKLLLIESIIPFACHDPSGDDDQGIPGSVPREAPAPLLANYGAVNGMTYGADMAMFVLHNSQERNIRHIDELLLSTGWKATLVRRKEGGGSFLQSIEAMPVEVPSA
ncbi:hypothetical protein D9615_002134 [Tricholomella constricta]|uniref:O-methyltransferase C-terminal domain-containing protein n=1 Tax=Tricholomella constricta TaxID=117010 RepID=A0A8H5HPD3_9AGAR|nr:hypothetical protein D9615_002134 [Tricholomella constricta]